MLHHRAVTAESAAETLDTTADKMLVRPEQSFNSAANATSEALMTTNALKDQIRTAVAAEDYIAAAELKEQLKAAQQDTTAAQVLASAALRWIASVVSELPWQVRKLEAEIKIAVSAEEYTEAANLKAKLQLLRQQGTTAQNSVHDQRATVGEAATLADEAGIADVSPITNAEPRSTSKESIIPTTAPVLSSEGLVQVEVRGPTGGTFKMHVHSKPEVISGHIRRTHTTFEARKCKQMLKHFQAASVNRESNVFIDVGGNIGSHTFCMASAGVKVLAFEALPLNANVLFNTVKYNKWSPQVQVVPKAAGATSPSPPLCMRGGHAESKNMGAFSAVDPASNPFKHIKGWHAELPCTMIETTTVDAEVERLSRERSVCPLVMKLDIEGYEHFALMGAQKTLSRLMPCAIYMVSDPCCLQALWHGA